MSKFEQMLVDRIIELQDKEKRDLAWGLLDEKTKDIVKSLINNLGIKSNE